jgi:NADH-quinone oxidoreductase subunit A
LRRIVPDSEKLSPYECGFEAFEDARMKFDVRYYLIAILFILFDLEVAFLLPWATIFKEIVQTDSVKWFGFIEMLVFHRHPGRGVCVRLGQGRSGLGVSDGH